MNFNHGYHAGRVVGEHYLNYLIGFQIVFWVGLPLAIMREMYAPPISKRHIDPRSLPKITQAA